MFFSGLRDRVIPELPDENLHLAPAQVKGFNLARKVRYPLIFLS
jgi:hypothetical protein